MGEKARDIPLEILINADRTSASVVIPTDFSVDMLNASLIGQCARDAGVIINAAVEKRCCEIEKDFLENPRKMEAVIAEAIPVENGENGSFLWIEGYDPNHIDDSKTHIIKEDGTTDHYNVMSYINVEVGTHIATLTPPTGGTDGLDVTGQNITAIPGKKYELTVDESVEVKETGEIIAEVTGVIQFSNRELRVSRVLEIPEFVDFSTGNIDFNGSVKVKEGVRDCFVVKATEDITIEGLIEAATIMCGRDFVCNCGMAAKDRGVLMVDGNVEINYLNNVRGRIKGNLEVKNEIVNCELAVAGNLISKMGSIIGGKVMVTGKVEIGKLGSEAGTKTRMYLASAPILIAQFNRLCEYGDNMKTLLEETQERLISLSQNKDSLKPEDHELMKTMAVEMTNLKNKLELCSSKQNELKAQITSTKTMDLSVLKVIHTHVHLIIQHREVVFENSLKGPVRIYWDESGVLQYRQSDGPVYPLANVTKELNIAA